MTIDVGNTLATCIMLVFVNLLVYTYYSESKLAFYRRLHKLCYRLDALNHSLDMRHVRRLGYLAVMLARLYRH